MRVFVRVLDWLATILGIIGLSLILATPAQAVTLPSFPSCTQPQGSVKASYDTGVHGIVGDSREYRGQDKVYQVAGHYLIQCFCPENSGTGIQTNWVTAETFSTNDQDFLQRSGWEWIADGSAWGLQAKPYLAKNSNYSCRDEGGIGGGDVLGASTGSYPRVLGLADTGAFQNYLFLFSLESVILMAAYFSRVNAPLSYTATNFVSCSSFNNH